MSSDTAARPDEKALLDVRSNGVSEAFEPHDLRSDTLRGLWPGADMGTDQVLADKLEELSKHLVADTYGGVQTVKYARQAYNSRRGAVTDRDLKRYNHDNHPDNHSSCFFWGRCSTR